MNSPQVRDPSMDETEKDPDVFVESNKVGSSQGSLLPLPEPGSPERLLAERKLVRKLDARLLPTIILIYIMNYIDVCSLSHQCYKVQP
jgi:hypothetical protein